MTDRADLESRVFLAIAKTMPTKQPAAVIEEIETTHYLLERAKALHLFNVLMAANKTRAAMYLHGALGLAEDEPISAADSVINGLNIMVSENVPNGSILVVKPPDTESQQSVFLHTMLEVVDEERLPYPDTSESTT